MSSILTSFYRPEAILLISPLPISTFSLYNFSEFGFLHTSIILPTLKSICSISGIASSTAFFAGCFLFYYYCYYYFGFFSCLGASLVSSFVVAYVLVDDSLLFLFYCGFFSAGALVSSFPPVFFSLAA